MTSNASPYQRASSLSGAGMMIAIVATHWHNDILSRLLSGAMTELEALGVAPANIHVEYVPGAYELPFAVKLLCSSQKYHAVIALGCIIRGETPHFDYVAMPVATALQSIQTETLVPVIFGVLTTDTLQQAMARSGGTHGNKGIDCASAAIEMANLANRLHQQ